MLQLTIMFSKYISFVKQAFLLLVLGILDYLIPIEPFIKASLSLVVIDFITKLLAVWKMEGSNRITSRKMKNSVVKFLLYSLAIIASHELHLLWMNKGITGGTYLTFLITTLVTITEFKSIIENVEYGTGTKIWEYVNEQIPFFKKILKK